MLGSVGTLFVVLWAGCGSRQVATTNCVDPEVVGYPPPPAQVERLEAPPDPRCQWLDGSWEWVGRRWQWKQGAWGVPPAGCSLAAPIMVWLPGGGAGVLYYRGASSCPTKSQTDKPARCGVPKPCSSSPDKADAGPS